jgi:hypothetical protein
MMKRIVVDPPTSDARRERVERKLFEQLAAVRMVERAEAVIPPARRSRAPMLYAFGALATAAVLALVLLGGGSPEGALPSPTRVVTPLGGTTQFTVPGALIEARSDTSVEVQHGPGGAVTLVVKRGSIACNVDHRVNRPPFRVRAGEVEVEVVGTIFTVSSAPNPRVDVARGTVRVTAPGGQWLVEAGETWPTFARTAAAEPPPTSEEPAIEAVSAPAVEPKVDDDQPAAERAVIAPKKKTAVQPPKEDGKVEIAKPDASVTKADHDLARETYRIANRLEQTDPHKAAQLYRSIATNGKGMESVALVSLAEVELRLTHPARALAALDELKKRFPNAANTEDAAWFRYEALRAMGKRDEARGAAAEYLRQFPNGAYADRLRNQ